MKEIYFKMVRVMLDMDDEEKKSGLTAMEVGRLYNALIDKIN